MGMEACKSGLVAHPKRSLAGKFFTTLLPPSFDRTESTLRQQWKLSGGLKVFPMEKYNIILFEFEQKRDKKKVVNDGPWNVDGIILVLKECPKETSMADIDFSVACFQVKVIGLPYVHYTTADAKKIGRNLSDEPMIWYKYHAQNRWFWAKAEINLNNPLPPGFYIDEGRKRPFVQFKYKNLGDFCENCGMISHRECGEVRKQRTLTGEYKTDVYGPWLRYDPEPAGSGLPVKSDYSQSQLCDEIGLEYEETLTYSQFLVQIEVDVVYASEHEWDGKKLIRSLLKSKYGQHRFRFPCSHTRFIRDVLAIEVDRIDISSVAILTAEDRASIVHGLADHLMKERETWSKQRWVPLLVRVEKTIMIPPVDMETMLQDAEDIKLHKAIDSKVIKLVVDIRFDKSDDLLRRTIRDAICEVGLTQFPDSFIESWVRCVKELDYFSLGVFKTLHPDHECFTVIGPDMDLFGTCCICQEDFFLGEEATFTSPCSHVFHTRCIEHWIQASQNCPLCRLQLQLSTC